MNKKSFSLSHTVLLQNSDFMDKQKELCALHNLLQYHIKTKVYEYYGCQLIIF